VGAFVLGACDDSSDPQTAAVQRTTVADSSDATAASSTAASPAEPASAVEVARGFLEAYGDFDADRALTYLTEDAIKTGAGDAGSWGSEDAFLLERAVSEGQALEQTITGCEEQGESAAGTVVRCAFDLHAFHSDEIGLGPYTGNHWDLVVRDGKITSAIATWDYFKNGFSAELWAPFKTWVASTYPEDVSAMYIGAGAANTEESARLWEQRTREWADTMKAGV
jgi:hypothetical protein